MGTRVVGEGVRGAAEAASRRTRGDVVFVEPDALGVHGPVALLLRY